MANPPFLDAETESRIDGARIEACRLQSPGVIP
jgi:hypothetical protein